MTVKSGTDSDWQRWGEQNPYYAVLSDDKYLKANLTSDSLQEFFASGERHIERVYDSIRTRIRREFQPARVLDFGCGTGRLVVPFAMRADSVVGIDVSPAMLNEARANCAERGIVNAQLLNLDEIDSLQESSFDLLHSFIVFQHIPIARGEFLLEKLISLLAEGGIGAVHLTYSNTRRAWQGVSRAYQLLPRVGDWLLNLLQRRPLNAPRMQMNCYSMNRVFDILLRAHCSNIWIEFSSHGTHHGAMVYFEKVARPLL